MSAIQPKTETVRNVVPLGRPTRARRVRAGARRSLAISLLAILGLFFGLLAGLFVVLATGLIALC